MLDLLKSLDPYAAALTFLALLWIGYFVATRSPRFWELAVSQDGRFSTSRFQVLVWTVVVLFAYAAVYVARIHAGRTEPVAEITPNVLLALGFSAGTAVAAAGITSSGVESGKVVKSAPSQVTPGLSALITDDAGRPDLGKAQLLAWTSVAIAAFLLATAGAVNATIATPVGDPLPSLPDIDPTLMVLMGIGQGAYLGPKLVTTKSTGIVSLSVSSAKPGATVTANGVGFGAAQAGSQLLLNGRSVAVDEWSDTAIKFTVPDPPPWGGTWTKQTLSVSVIVTGQPGATAQPLQVEP